MYCNDRGFCQISPMVCAYLCKKRIKLKCKEYVENYPKLIALEISPHYLETYGPPDFPMPKETKTRKKKQAREVVAKVLKKSKKEESAKVIAVATVEEVKPKRKRRTKAGLELAKQEAEISVKPKRKRRTKAEMVAAKEKEAKQAKKKQPKKKKEGKKK